MSVYSLSTLPKSVSIDRALIPKSYRDYLDILKGMGELIEIDDEVDWYLELGAIFRHSAETLAPGAIFNNVKGCPPGFRAADFGMGKSGTPGQPWGRLAIMLGLPPDTDLMSIQHAYLDAMDTGTRQPPRMVDAASAPCKQNKWFGDDIDITKFPAVIGHDGDGGRYINLGGINIVRTPDGKWTNWSTNRGEIVDRNHMTGLWMKGQHNGMIWRKWAAEGKDMPWAVAMGVSPVVATQAGSRCPDWVDEYDRASALLNDAIEMVGQFALARRGRDAQGAPPARIARPRNAPSPRAPQAPGPGSGTGGGGHAAHAGLLPPAPDAGRRDRPDRQPRPRPLGHRARQRPVHSLARPTAIRTPPRPQTGRKRGQ